ncbi:MAG: hypothetical protein MUQ10_07240, partial [Anaerolineae bacterium]|nr:hypothetical protein [Anaerolineae bacterium]
EYTARAGEHARLAYANDEARLHYGRALVLLEAADPGGAAQSWRLTALSGLGKLSFHAGEIAKSERYFREAIALGRELELDPQEMAIVYHWLGEALWWQAKYEEMLRIGEEELALLGDDTESLGAALINQVVAMASVSTGDEARCIELTKRTACFIEDLPYVAELRPAYNHIMLVCRWAKDADSHQRWLASLAQLAGRHGDLGAMMAVHSGAANLMLDTGDVEGAIVRTNRSLETTVRSGDLKHEGWAWGDLAELHLMSGRTEESARCAERNLRLSRTVEFPRDVANSQCLVGLVALCREDWGRAIEAFRKAEPLYEVARSLEGPAESRYLLGRAYLASGDGCQAQQCFEGALLSLTELESDFDLSWLFVPLLSGLDAALGDLGAFQAWVRRFRAQPSLLEGILERWSLERAEIRQTRGRPLLLDGIEESRPDWIWEDRFGDCSRRRDPGKGLTIRAANARHLWKMNLSAPRLLRSWPGDVTDAVVQVTCEPALDDRPAIGGLLLWRDKRDYLWLEVGRFGQRDVAFGGCLDNRDLVIGRGRLPEGPEPGWAMGEPVTLRLEVDGDRVDAFCSLDGEQWYTVGHATFPIDDTVQVGVHAIGMIDRTIYHGAYPEGTAIRFTDFKVWGAQEPDCECGPSDAMPDGLP